MNPRKQLDRIQACAEILLEILHQTEGKRISPVMKRIIWVAAEQIHQITCQWTDELYKPALRGEPEGEQTE